MKSSVKSKFGRICQFNKTFVHDDNGHLVIHYIEFESGELFYLVNDRKLLDDFTMDELENAAVKQCDDILEGKAAQSEGEAHRRKG